MVRDKSLAKVLSGWAGTANYLQPEYDKPRHEAPEVSSVDVEFWFGDGILARLPLERIVMDFLAEYHPVIFRSCSLLFCALGAGEPVKKRLKDVSVGKFWHLSRRATETPIHAAASHLFEYDLPKCNKRLFLRFSPKRVGENDFDVTNLTKKTFDAECDRYEVAPQDYWRGKSADVKQFVNINMEVRKITHNAKTKAGFLTEWHQKE